MAYESSRFTLPMAERGHLHVARASHLPSCPLSMSSSLLSISFSFTKCCRLGTMAYESLCFRLPMAERGHLHIARASHPSFCSFSVSSSLLMLSFSFAGRHQLVIMVYEFLEPLWATSNVHFSTSTRTSSSCTPPHISCIFPHRSSQLLATI